MQELVFDVVQEDDGGYCLSRRVRDLVVTPHRLADYDPETRNSEETEDD